MLIISNFLDFNTKSNVYCVKDQQMFFYCHKEIYVRGLKTMTKNPIRFCDLLRIIIENSGISIRFLATQSGLDRTFLQKVLSGNRRLSIEQLDKLLPFLIMTPSETEFFQQIYMQEYLGEDVYLRCQCIKNLAEHIFTASNPSYNLSSDIDLGQCTYPCYINHHNAILGVLNTMFEQLVQGNTEPYIHFFSSLNHDFIIDVFHTLSQKKFEAINVTHIVPFIQSSYSDDFRSIYNVKMLPFLLSFAFTLPDNYRIHFYYEAENITELSIPFPYYMITNHHILMLSGDFENAILFRHEPNNVCEQNFQRLSTLSRPLLNCSIFPIDSFNIEIITGNSYLSYKKLSEHLKKDSCKTLLKQILDRNENREEKIYMTNESAFHPFSNIIMYSTGGNAYFIYFSQTNYNICTIHEPTIAMAIQEFMNHGITLGYFYDTNETSDLIREMLVS